MFFDNLQMHCCSEEFFALAWENSTANMASEVERTSGTQAICYAAFFSLDQLATSS